MSCDNCPGSKKPDNVDKRGNIIGEKAEMQGKAPSPHLVPTHPVLEQFTFEEYITQKTIHRKQAETESNKAVKSFSEEYKKIQIQELIDVVNHEDASPLSPTQAIKALKALSEVEEYKNTFTFFSGLLEQVDSLYEKLVENNKIKIKWNI